MKKHNGGFTLSELLAVVGILAVLLAAAIPGIVAIDRNLKQKRLDDYAREIFVEAQNQLLARNIVGTAANVDATATKSGEYCWLVDNDSVRLLLEGDAIDIIEDSCHCILKYNPVTATVLEVYYASQAMDAETVIGGTYSGEGAAEQRKELHIGYFSGSDADSGKIAHMPEPQLEILNGEELKIKVTVPALAPTSGSFAGVKQKVTLTVQELNSTGQAVVGKSFELTGESSVTEAGCTEEIILDSLENGSFKTISGGKITPGANILITATVCYDSGGKSGLAYLSTAVSGKTNSLFASRSGSTARIACWRHLQNLDTGVSGVSGITAAVQTDQIQRWEDAHTANFTPISNSALRSYDGKNNEILRLDVSVASGVYGNAGLFASLDSATLKNIRLCDIDIYNPSVASSMTDISKSTGALAGRLTNCNVSNCRVYNSARVFGNTSYVGGLIGSASGGTVTGCFANVFKIKSDYGLTVGGLIGCALDVAISNSYSNIGVMTAGNPYPVWSGDSGLVSEGNGNGKPNGTVGGLVGYGSNSSVSHCYTCGYVLIAGNANSYFGAGSAGCTYSDCYSLLSYNGSAVDDFTTPTNNNCWADNVSNLQNPFGINAENLLWWADNAGTGWASMNESYPTNINGVTLAAPYPYPMIEGTPHYGDWPAPGAVDTDSHVFSKLSSAADSTFKAYDETASYYVSVEQIPGSDGLLYNQKTLTAYATGAGTASAVVWQVLKDGAYVSIADGGVELYSGTTARAHVQLNTAFKTYDGHSTGGSVRIVGRNAHDFDTTYNITLRVRSILGTEDDWETVNVKVMPQLKLSPDAATANSGGYIIGSSGNIDIAANRSINDVKDISQTGNYGWVAQWTATNRNGNPVTSGFGANTMAFRISYAQRADDFYNLALVWGPYKATATALVRAYYVTGLTSITSGDGIITDNSVDDHRYLLLENGGVRTMSFSWAGREIIYGSPSISYSLSDNNSNINVTASPNNPAPNNIPYAGSLIYTVNGLDYTDAIPVRARWVATQEGLGSDTSSAICDVYVVGLEGTTELTQTTQLGGSALQMNGAPVSFGVKAHFPGTDIIKGDRRFTWSVDDNDYISLGTPTSSGMESGVTIVPVKANVGAANVSVNVKCTFSIAGTPFFYERVFTVVIPPMREPLFIKTVKNDISDMTGFSETPSEADWVEPCFVSDAWRITEGKSIYLKADGVYYKTTNQADGFHDTFITTDSTNITVEEMTTAAGTYYYRITANPDTAGQTASATIKIGAWSGTLNFALTSQPTLSVTAYTRDGQGTETELPSRECTAGETIYLKLTAVPDLEGLTWSGENSSYMSITRDGYYLCVSTLWPESDTGDSAEITLTISIPNAANCVETLTILKPAPPVNPAPPPQYDTASPSPSVSVPPTVEPTSTIEPEDTP